MERVKQVLTRFATMFLALMCVIGMGTPVFADNIIPATGTFTVGGLDTSSEASGIQITAYQIISVNLNNNQVANPLYIWNDSVADWMTNVKGNDYGSYVTTLTPNDGKYYVSEAFEKQEPEGTGTTGITQANATKFYEELTAEIRKPDSTISIDQKFTKRYGDILDGKVTFGTEENGMPLGVYLIVITGGVKTYQPTIVTLLPKYSEGEGKWNITSEVGITGTTEVKSVDPSISKTVSDETVSIGDTVTYTLTVVVPDYPIGSTAPELKVFDTLGSALTYGGSVSVDLVGENNQSTSVANTNYSSTSEDELNGKTFELDFKNDFVLANGGKTLKITYTAKVGASASNADDVLKNTAVLTYSADPYSYVEETKDDSKNVYTYKTVINKVDSGGSILPGAEFKLTKQVVNESATSEKEMYFKETATTVDKSTTYSYTYDSSINTATDGYTTSLKVGTDGKLPISGLDEGTYTLTETKAPQGYVVPTGSITFTIEHDKSEGGSLANLGTVLVTPKGEAKLYDTSSQLGGDKGYSKSGDTLTIKVQNISEEEANFTLPSTGGMGTLIFTVGGLFVMAGAVVLAVVMYKKKNA